MPITNVAKVSDWNAERGYGFAFANGKKYFVHKTALGPITRNPEVGDTIIVTQFLETPKGSRISSGVLEGVPLRPIYQKKMDRTPDSFNFRKVKRAIGTVVFVIALAIGLFQQCQKEFFKDKANIASKPVQKVTKQEEFHEPFYTDEPFHDESYDNSYVEPSFQCDGRTSCGQMRSYEEALFFLNNCPGVHMDGDGDGIPCERRFGR